MQVSSAYAPNAKPVLPNTRSPTANSVTEPPIAAISPASSLPRIRFLGLRIPETSRLMTEIAGPLRRLASRVAQSARVTATARTLMRTSSSFGTGGTCVLAGNDERTSSYYVAVFPYGGGHGASSRGDGLIYGTHVIGQCAKSQLPTRRPAS